MFSVIIPNYNQQRYIRDSIESVINQTFRDFEIIVVDDGSTDESKKIIDEFSGSIKYIWQENKGLAGARNTGIRAARGEFVAFLDADDLWLPEYLKTMVYLTNMHSEASVYFCRAQCMDTHGNSLPQIVGGEPAKQSKLYTSLLQSNFLIPSTITIRRATVIDAGYFDQKLRSCEDWDLWLRILPDTTFIGTEDILVRYRVHDQSLSANVSGMHTAKQAVVEKQFGLDDGEYYCWSPEKRIAYSGLYRYFLITAIQRGANWQAGIENLFKSLHVDPSRASDIDLFYELALGIQPVGFRGSAEKIDIADNAQEVINLIKSVFELEAADQIQHLKRQIFGTAYYAIGLAAYNTGHIKFCRSNLWLAGMYRPSLWISTNLPSILTKSLLGNAALDNLRRFKNPS